MEMSVGQAKAKYAHALNKGALCVIILTKAINGSKKITFFLENREYSKIN